MQRVATGTALGRAACFSFSISDGLNKEINRIGIKKACPALVAARKTVPSSGGTSKRQERFLLLRLAAVTGGGWMPYGPQATL